MFRFKILFTLGFSVAQLYALPAASQEPAEVLTRKDSLSFYFPLNSDEINALQVAKGAPVLNRIRKGLVDSVIVQAFADSSGTASYNQGLSERRMEKAWQLIALPVTKTSRPYNRIAWGETRAGHLTDSLDRRVDIIVCWKETLQMEKTLVLSDLYFIPDRAELQPAGIDVLKSLATQMAGYRDRPIDVRGHVNYQRRKLSVTDPYFKLSEARAKLVADYLIEHGHSPALIRAIGMGNWQPAVPDPRTVPEKESNMRVEIILYQ